jgi:hypothetical protein
MGTCCFELGAISGRDSDACSKLSECLGELQPKSAGATGHHGDLSFEAEKAVKRVDLFLHFLPHHSRQLSKCSQNRSVLASIGAGFPILRHRGGGDVTSCGLGYSLLGEVLAAQAIHCEVDEYIRYFGAAL